MLASLRSHRTACVKALALVLACSGIALAQSPSPAPAPAAARLDTGSYTIEGKNLTWNQRSGDFTIPSDVKFTQPGTDVTGDRAQGNSVQRKVTITGHVVLHNSKPVTSLGVTSKNASDEPQTLTTDQLQVDGPAKLYIATGNVKFIQGAKTVTADRGQLNQMSHLLDLQGHVHIDDASSGQSMIAETVQYDTSTETVNASGAPFQIRAPAQDPGAPRRPGHEGPGHEAAGTEAVAATESLFGDKPQPRTARKGAPASAPLAARMRPRTLDEFVGQEQLVGPGRVLRRAIESDTVPSMILWGPPGTGKTTLAEIIAGQSGAHFVALSAVSAGVADLRRVVAQAHELQKTGRRTVLFVDEIHRFNKAQQDAVLPYVEDGTVTLIGATTENPSFEVISALLSRSRVFVLQALKDEEVASIVDRALGDGERGLASRGIVLEPAARDALVNLANGDARAALGTLEFAAAIAPVEGGIATITREIVAEALQRRATGYDRAGDAHYDTVSAFIKTIRGSDPDGALYWLARMVDAGEDPLFIVRRLVILASEDVGLADSRGLQVAVAAQQAVHFIGMPEGFYALAHATLYLALAPKSNSIGRAYGAAEADVKHSRNEPVPLHLRNAPTSLMEDLGYGKSYRYAHDDYAMVGGGDLPPAERLQSYLPESLGDRAYYQPGEQGEERKYVDWIRERRRGGGERDPFAADDER